MNLMLTPHDPSQINTHRAAVHFASEHPDYDTQNNLAVQRLFGDLKKFKDRDMANLLIVQLEEHNFPSLSFDFNSFYKDLMQILTEHTNINDSVKGAANDTIETYLERWRHLNAAAPCFLN